MGKVNKNNFNSQNYILQTNDIIKQIKEIAFLGNVYEDKRLQACADIESKCNEWLKKYGNVKAL